MSGGGSPWGAFSSVTAGISVSCGLRTDGTATCWGSDDPRDASLLAVPAHAFSTVSAGAIHSCGVRAADDAIVCWGRGGPSRLNAPAGAFVAVTVGNLHSCGLRADGTVLCWGGNPDGQSDAPAGSFTQIDAGNKHSCGVRADQTVACWGEDDRGQLGAPPGAFTAVSAGHGHACGLRADQTVECWGANAYGQSDPPQGAFSQVAAGDLYSCGLRTDGTIMCWGTNFYGHVGAPSATQRIRCRPQGAAGFHRPVFADDGYTGSALVRDGTFDVLVAFTEFGDARHSEEFLPWRESLEHLDAVADYIEAQTYGHLDVRFTVAPQWLTASETAEEYLVDSSNGDQALFGPVAGRVSTEASRFVDVTNGGEHYDTLMVITPPSQFNRGAARGFSWDIDESRASALARLGSDAVRGVVIVGAFRPREREVSPRSQLKAWVSIHELMHQLGLDDLYNLYSPDRFVIPPGRESDYVRAKFGMMGLGDLRWPAPAGARELQGVTGAAHPASGPTVRDALIWGYDTNFDAQETLGWWRWARGWLAESQMVCLEPGAASVRLAPVAAPGDDIGLVVVPVTSRQLLVLESRRRLGYDADQPFAQGMYYRPLPYEGVFAYTVDSQGGHLPISMLGDDGTGYAPHSPILMVGERAAIDGGDGGPEIEIAVVSDDGIDFQVDVEFEPPTLTKARYDLDVTRTFAALSSASNPGGGDTPASSG